MGLLRGGVIFFFRIKIFGDRVVASHGPLHSMNGGVILTDVEKSGQNDPILAWS